jgi:hypothetical protein
MRIESDGKSKGNPRLYELVEHAPKTGKSPTVWAWPELIDYLKIAGQPVSGPWPPHQQPRPDPDYESGPVAVADPHSAPSASSSQPTQPAQPAQPAQSTPPAASAATPPGPVTEPAGPDASAGGASAI